MHPCRRARMKFIAICGDDQWKLGVAAPGDQNKTHRMFSGLPVHYAAWSAIGTMRYRERCAQEIPEDVASPRHRPNRGLVRASLCPLVRPDVSGRLRGSPGGLLVFAPAGRMHRLPLRRTEDLIFLGALGVVLGGRLGYVFFYGWEQLREDPLWLIRVWEGGMSFHGGLLGVLIAMALFARTPRAGRRRCTRFRRAAGTHRAWFGSHRQFHRSGVVGASDHRALGNGVSARSAWSGPPSFAAVSGRCWRGAAVCHFVGGTRRNGGRAGP